MHNDKILNPYIRPESVRNSSNKSWSNWSECSRGMGKKKHRHTRSVMSKNRGRFGGVATISRRMRWQWACGRLCGTNLGNGPPVADNNLERWNNASRKFHIGRHETSKPHWTSRNIFFAQKYYIIKHYNYRNIMTCNIICISQTGPCQVTPWCGRLAICLSVVLILNLHL